MNSNPIDGTQGYPLSYRQNLIWMGQRLNPATPLYNMALSFEIEGDIQIDRFQQAFQALIQSSDSLRSTFHPWENQGSEGPPIRLVGSPPDTLEFIDLSQRDDSRERCRESIKQRSRAPFDLEKRGFDSALYKLGDERYVWFFNQHHIITDAWSSALCFRRLESHYQALARGEAISSQSYPSYEQYVNFEKSLEKQPVFSKASNFWSNQAENLAPPTTFYGTHVSSRTARTERVVYSLGRERSQKARERLRTGNGIGFTAEISAFHTFATALLALMHRVGGEHDRLTFLAPTHNRSTRDLKNTIGLLMDVLPVTVGIDPGETIRSMEKKVAQEYRAALLHSVPGALPTSAEAGDVVLNYIPSTFGSFAGMNCRTEWVHPDHGDPAHSLRLQVHDFGDDDEFQLHFDFHCDVFGQAERALTVRHFQVALDAILDHQDTRLRDLEWLTPQEFQHEIENGNQSEVTWPHTTLVERMESCAREYASHHAIQSGAESLTFEELHQAADALATELREQGLGRGKIAALIQDRSADFVISILAVLKAGGAYLPLEKSLPPERILKILEESEAIVALADRDWMDREDLKLPPTCRVLDPTKRADTQSPPGNQRPSDFIDRRSPTQPEDLAYVIYTSGSTGGPKGVMVSHEAIAHYGFWASRHYAQDRPCDFALFTPVSVDLTLTSIIVPLLTGGSIHIYRQGDDQQDLSVLQVFEDDAVDVVKLTPSHLTMLLAHRRFRLERIKSLIVGGEALTSKLAQRTHDALSPTAIYNEYGPTEATVGCMIHRFDPEQDTGAAVPIGLPISNARIYLLDQDLRPVPEGVPGEIWIGGKSVALGYLGQSELTAERFVQSPFLPGELLYRTGDFGRRDPNTSLIVYRGRKDDQVKIRGVRIELSEIQDCLESHPRVQQCVVTLQEREKPQALPTSAWDNVEHCVRCGLASNHPDCQLDANKICSMCHEYDGYKQEAQRYFGTRDEFESRLKSARSQNSSEYDCLMLLSGGKDSTYALYQLVDMGLRVLVFSLDNGFISESAKANIKRVVEDLGLELVFGSTPSMNAIFADSLQRFSNVCQGCFKTIYTLSMNIARERKIPFIVTGLSRGQIFETRLAGFYRSGVRDPEQIDHMVIEARKAYHRMDDAVSRQLDVSLFSEDAIFEDIQFVDFYRYCDTPLFEVLEFIKNRAAWVRPEDTGRSTNCLINDSGIFVHKRERGFHNYALPYSWDVRLEHKTVDECLDELDDEIDEESVNEILREVGYHSSKRREDLPQDQRLVAYYVPGQNPSTSAELRAFVSERLPAAMVPQSFMALESLPLNRQGKLDKKALPQREGERVRDAKAASSPTEKALVEIWGEILGLESVGVDENFLDLGGDSIQTIQMVSRARSYGLKFLPRDVFTHPTIAELAQLTDSNAQDSATMIPVNEPPGPFVLTPIQRAYLTQENPHHFAQSMVLEASEIDHQALERALNHVIGHHESLRLRLVGGRPEEMQEVVDVHSAIKPECIDLQEPLTNALLKEVIDSRSAQLDLNRADLVRVVLLRSPGQTAKIVLVIHHFATDALSWDIILDDLENAYRAEQDGKTPSLPQASISWKSWVHRLNQREGSGQLSAQEPYWQAHDRTESALPIDQPKASVPGRNDSEESVSIRLSVEETEKLETAVSQHGALRTADVVLSSLAQALCEWTQETKIRIDLEHHGRDPSWLEASMDNARTTGWFSHVFPVVLTSIPGDPHATLRDLRQSLDLVPEQGEGFGWLKESSSHSRVRDHLRSLSSAPVLFNYLGQAHTPLRDGKAFQVHQGLGVSRSPASARSHLLDSFAYLENNRLVLTLAYSRDIHHRETLESVAKNAKKFLQQFLRDGIDPSPQDFPHADLDASDLDDILREYGDSP